MKIHDVIALALICGCSKGGVAPNTFSTHAAWVRAADSGATTAAYVTLVNGTRKPVVAHAFGSDQAVTVELHRSDTDSAGAVHMSMLDSIVVPPRDSIVMKPGGYHLMLIGTTSAVDTNELVRLSMRLGNDAVVSTTARAKR